MTNNREARIRRRIRKRFLKLLHRGTGLVAAPAGPLERRLTQDLRASPASVDEDLEFADSRPYWNYVSMQWLRNWHKIRQQIPKLSNLKLSELRAAVEYEEIIAPFLSPAVQAARESLEKEGAVFPPLSFLCAVKDEIGAEIAKREACGQMIRRAAPWPMPKSSAAELCKCAEISANAHFARALMPELYSQNAESFCPRSDVEYTALAWLHNSRRAKELPEVEFEAVHVAMEVLEGMFNPYLKRPDSIATRMRDAIKAERPRRQFKVMLAIMLARERPAALAAGLATALAALPSRPLEMIAEAMRKPL